MEDVKAVKSRDYRLDVVRLIASILVVQGHLLNADGGVSIAINICHLPTFYFVSGLLAFQSGEKYTPGQLLRKKTVALVIPYFLWSSVSFLFNIILSILRKEPISPKSLKSEAVDIFLYGRSVWFLIQLFFAFCVLILCLKLAKHGARLYAVNIAVYSALLLLLPNDLLSFYKFKWLYPFFLLGYAMADILHRSGDSIKRILRILSTLGLFSCAFPLLAIYVVDGELCQQYANFAYEKAIYALQGVGCYLISLMGIAFIFWIANLLVKTRFAAALAEMGAYSLDIYVIHMFFIKALQFLEVYRKIEAAISLSFFAATVISIIVYFVSKYLLRKSKIYCISVGIVVN